jgi:hypothetical protein
MNSLNRHGSSSRLAPRPLSIGGISAVFALWVSVGAHATTSSLASADLVQTSAPTIIRSTGAIEADVALFRALLGGPDNGAMLGQQPSGRREINWDGVPALFTDVPTFPNDFFNVNSPRGLIYETTGPGLEVSDRSFIDLGQQYAGEFIPFSGHKLFSPVGTNDVVARFVVAGSGTKAAVRGIGVVFCDVDKPGKSAIGLLGANGRDLGHFAAPVRSDRRGLSFVGIVFRKPVIETVRVVAGDSKLGDGEIDVSQGGLHDLVVMDDFIYGEPTAIGQ